jgi:hypothetical protein
MRVTTESRDVVFKKNVTILLMSLSGPSPSLLSQNGLVPSPNFDGWPLLQLRTSASTGRSLFAARAIPAHTLVQVVDRPFASVILRPFRKEVCSWCFGYDNGRRWKVAKLAFRFCEEKCREAWEAELGHVGLAALSAVAEVKPAATAKSDREEPENVPARQPLTLAEIERAWEESGEFARAVSGARRASTPTKAQARAIQKARQALTADDEDDVYFLLSGILGFARSDQESRDFTTLAPSYDPYLSRPDTLSSHIRMYHFLLAIVPPSLLDHVTPLTLLSIVTRDSHNSFSIRDAGSESDYTTTEFLGYGTWSLASFYNHSCEPNVVKQRQGRSMTFRTFRVVGEGEELVISYLGGEENLKEAVDERAERLRVGWGFVCGCARCRRESARGVASRDGKT